MVCRYLKQEYCPLVAESGPSKSTKSHRPLWRKADIHGLTEECRQFLTLGTAALPPEADNRYFL